MSDLEKKLAELKAVIDESVNFPTYYQFKFIVPISEINILLPILEGMVLEQKPSANGNYISVTAKQRLKFSEEIIDIYRKVSIIKGIISL